MKFEDPQNRYGLDALIQSGSSARIYRGTNPDTGGPVAVKILEIGKHDSQGILRRVFLDRSAILSQLEHPSLPVLLEAGLTPEKDAFLVFDWVEGPSVSEIGPISPTDALTAMIRVLEGLECLALHNLVHWNLSPESIILGGSILPRTADGAPPADQRTRIVGLGVSLLPMEWWPHHLQALAGEDRYVAPELKQLGIAPTAAVGGAWWRCDLYSVAMITCGLLGAEVTGAGTSNPKVETLPGVRTGLHELLEQCLREDPNERPVSFSEVIKIFQHSMPRDRRESREDVLSTNDYALRDLGAEDPSSGVPLPEKSAPEKAQPEGSVPRSPTSTDPLSTQDLEASVSEAATIEVASTSQLGAEPASETLPGFVMPEEIRPSRPGIELASTPSDIDPDETQKVAVDMHRTVPADFDLSTVDVDGLLADKLSEVATNAPSSSFSFSDPFETEELASAQGVAGEESMAGAGSADAALDRLHHLHSADVEKTLALDSPELAELDAAAAGESRDEDSKQAQKAAADSESAERSEAGRAQPPASPGGAPTVPTSRLGSGALATAAIADKIKSSLKDLLPEPDPTPRDDLLEDVEDFEKALAHGRDGSAPPQPPGKTPTSMPAMVAPEPASTSGSSGDAENASGKAAAGGAHRSASRPATPLLDSMNASGRTPLRLVALAAVVVVSILLIRAVLPDRDVGASRDQDIIKVREFSRDQPVELGPSIDQIEAPPPPPLAEEIEQAILAFDAGELSRARTLLRPLRDQDAAGELSPEMCEIYRPLAESIDRAFVTSALSRLSSSLSSSDARALRATLNSLSTSDLRRMRTESGGIDLLERSNRALDRIDRIEQQLKRGEFEAALESSVVLYREDRGFEQRANLRERSAMGLERQIDALNQDGRHDEARSKLARLEQIWPDRPGLSERREGVAKSERSQGVYLELLARAEATIEDRPHEGLEILAGAQPPYGLVPRFAAVEESLQERLSELDSEDPRVRVDPSRPVEYRKGRPVVVGLIAEDDYEVLEIAAFVRIESETDFRQLEVTASGGSSYQFEVPSAVHVDRPIDYYVTVRDRSGNTGSLSSADSPTTLKRKRWYRP